jgi:hypothetical protein
LAHSNLSLTNNTVGRREDSRVVKISLRYFQRFLLRTEIGLKLLFLSIQNRTLFNLSVDLGCATHHLSSRALLFGFTQRYLSMGLGKLCPPAFN